MDSTIDNTTNSTTDTNRVAVCLVTYPHNSRRAIVDVPNPTTLDPQELADIITSSLSIPAPVRVDAVDHIYILDDAPKQRVLDYINYIDIDDADQNTIRKVMSSTPHGVTIWLERGKQKVYHPTAKPWRAMCYYDGVPHHIDVDCHANDYEQLVSRLSSMGYAGLPMVVRWVLRGIYNPYYTMCETDDHFHYLPEHIRVKIEKKYTPTRNNIPYYIDLDANDVLYDRWYDWYCAEKQGTPRAWRAIAITKDGERRWVYTTDIDIDQAIGKLKKGKHPVNEDNIRQIFWVCNFK